MIIIMCPGKKKIIALRFWEYNNSDFVCERNLSVEHFSIKHEIVQYHLYFTIREIYMKHIYKQVLFIQNPFFLFSITGVKVDSRSSFIFCSCKKRNKFGCNWACDLNHHFFSRPCTHAHARMSRDPTFLPPWQMAPLTQSEFFAVLIISARFV